MDATKGTAMNNSLTMEQFRDWYLELPIFTYGELTEQELLDNFQQILTWKNDRVFISDEIPDSKFTVLEYWLMLGLLEDCIEYGTSPRGAWLTDFGEELLEFLNSGKHLKYIEEYC